MLKQLEKNQTIIEKARLDLIKAFGELDENGMPKIENNNFVIKPENKEKFEAEVKALYDIELLISANPLKLSQLKQLDKDSKYLLTAQEIIILEDILDEEDLKKEIEAIE